jgi:hypothetical protein
LAQADRDGAFRSLDEGENRSQNGEEGYIIRAWFARREHSDRRIDVQRGTVFREGGYKKVMLLDSTGVGK